MNWILVASNFRSCYFQVYLWAENILLYFRECLCSDSKSVYHVCVKYMMFYTILICVSSDRFSFRTNPLRLSFRSDHFVSDDVWPAYESVCRDLVCASASASVSAIWQVQYFCRRLQQSRDYSSTHPKDDLQEKAVARGSKGRRQQLFLEGQHDWQQQAVSKGHLSFFYNVPPPPVPHMSLWTTWSSLLDMAGV